MTVALVIIYVITQAVHQLLQPKLVGDSVGLNPLVTLILLIYRIPDGRDPLDDPGSAHRYGAHQYVSGRGL